MGKWEFGGSYPTPADVKILAQTYGIEVGDIWESLLRPGERISVVACDYGHEMVRVTNAALGRRSMLRALTFVTLKRNYRKVF